MSVWIKRLLYILVLSAALVGTVLLTMPVQFLAVQFGLPESVRIGHLTGTVWSGRATEVAYQGRIGQLTPKDTQMDLAWKWCPGWNRGPAAMCVRMESLLLKGEAALAYSLLGGGLEVSDARLRVQLQGYPLNIGPLKSKLKGVGDINIERLSLDPGDARVLTGLLADGELSSLQVGGFELGDYLWRAGTEEGAGLTSEFSGGDDRFKIKGQASLNLNDRSYRYTANMKTEDQGLLELLKSRASKSGRNSLTFSGDGKLGP